MYNSKELIFFRFMLIGVLLSFVGFGLASAYFYKDEQDWKSIASEAYLNLSSSEARCNEDRRAGFGTSTNCEFVVVWREQFDTSVRIRNESGDLHRYFLFACLIVPLSFLLLFYVGRWGVTGKFLPLIVRQK